MNETWKEIPDTEYSVSDQGRVASHQFGRWKKGWRVLKGNCDSCGYLQVVLYDGGGGQRTVRVHKLVAEAFLGEPPTPAHQVNHKNGVKTDNRADNFEYVTSKENIRHSLDVLGRKRAHGEAIGSAKVTEADVREIIRRCAAGESQRRIAAAYGICQPAVSRIVTRKQWGWL